jgi:hypothetical protein
MTDDKGVIAYFSDKARFDVSDEGLVAGQVGAPNLTSFLPSNRRRHLTYC